MGNTASSDQSFLDDTLPVLPYYTGEPVVYHHVIINTVLDQHVKVSWTKGVDMKFSSTDLEKFFSQLGAMYGQGYRMIVFLSLPAGFRRYGTNYDLHHHVKFHGVFLKMSEGEMNERWELCHTKSKLVTSRTIDYSFTRFSNKQTSNIEAIKETVEKMSESGGKLICIEMTSLLGKELEMKEKVTPLRKGQNPAIEIDVDIFFEKRLSAGGGKYIYEFVSCSLISSIKHYCWHTELDLGEDARKYLSTGWRIADIFVDHSSSIEGKGFAPKPIETTNCFLIFEKAASLLDDPRPRYEVTVADKWFKTTNKLERGGFGGAQQIITTDWENMIDHFGKYGWEVIRILKTKDERPHKESFTKYALYTRHLVFFQRQYQGVTD